LSRELWIYRLSDFIGKINQPILVVIGKKDIQVDWKTDGELLEKAVAQNPNVSFVYPENANHVLKYEEKPREALTAQGVSLRYNESDGALDGETVEVIVDWLKKRISF
jgi:fermentation-respiration switch protein FrsA (DUF1100 family)